ncbi:MAG: prolyl oligopeptidase family serine peptidase [Deltaproteobacteria bacterium]|nr:prolyl oligopeptidase family serine peptidase [Deltaproteobacteria bacterium]
MTPKRVFACLNLSALLVCAARDASADDLVVVPARDGAIGAWLVAAPLRATQQKSAFLPMDSKIADVADDQLKLESGFEVAKGAALRLVTSSDEHIDLIESAKAPESEAFALAGGLLRVSEPTRVLMILGVDDGVRVMLDGRDVFTRDQPRPLRESDDVVRLDLTKGDHSLVLRLHQRAGRWDFRARLLDERDMLPAASVRWVLPGAASASLQEIAAGMASVQVDLQTSTDRYHPVVQVRFPGGAPANAPLPVKASAWGVRGGKQPVRTRLFEVTAGEVARADRSLMDLRVELPAILASDLGEVEDDGSIELEVEVAGRTFKHTRPVRSSVRRAIGRIDQALPKLDQATQPMIDRDMVRSTLQHDRERLGEFISSGDKDIAATVDEAAEVEKLLDRLQAGQDPIATARGPIRLAYSSPLDGKTHPFGLYVPPSLSAAGDRKRPMTVVLHGLNGKPMQMIRWFFGRDDPGQNGSWEDRHVGRLPDLDAFVVAPSGLGNLGYRDAGEVDVMAVRDWVAQKFPVDPLRVYVTGPSMGGIGAGAVALRFADKFAAAAPLCGYHSYFLRNDMGGKRLRPWERSLAEFYSNVWWAENGLHTPMYIVHGTRDLPEENSGVLIKRYKDLGYVIEDEHPDEGHNVWQKTYEDFKAWQWLSRYKRDPEPRRVVLKTSSLRHADNAWVHITQLASHLTWASVRASWRPKGPFEVSTTAVEGLRLDRPSKLVGVSPVTAKIDGVSLAFEGSETIEAHRSEGKWVKGPAPQRQGLSKTAHLSGPIHDIYLEPLIFVYGTRDPSMTRASYEVAKAFAEPPYGVELRWPIVADVDLDETAAAGHSLFLVGNAKSNSWIKSLEERLPIRVEGDAIVAGSHRFTGRELGAMFIHPNPRFPQRYVVVLQAADAPGLLRGMSLPRLLPDFVVYDESVAGARGQLVLGGASVLAAGLFDGQWRMPEKLDDPGRSKKP